MTKIKTLFVLVTMLTMTKIATAQCNVDKWNSDDNIFIQAKFEEIYKNDDFENGLLTSDISISLAVNNADHDKVKYFMQIKVSTLRPKVGPIPRNIKIKFEDGAEISIDAESSDDPKFVGRVKVESCLFRLNGNIIKSIEEKGIATIIINDSRTANSLTTRPYKNILKEQWQCILKSYDKL